MDALKLKVPPPVVALLTAACMWLIVRAAPGLAFAFPARLIIAGCVAAAGIGISIAGVAAFRRVGTTVNPMRPERASTLVTWGIFKFTRNPMYVGLLLGLLAWAIFLSNGLAFLWLPVFVFYMNRFQIGPEEQALFVTFEREFAAYKSAVRRWV
jgi:protein-S-isoprenylcysteine O-methyltransferase Ste14